MAPRSWRSVQADGGGKAVIDPMADNPPGNPAYGDGYFVRTTRFRRLGPGELEAVMEDGFHALAMILYHDDHALQRVTARWERHPLTSCAGAELAMQDLGGVPLVDDLRIRWLAAQPDQQCTHMFDTLRLAAVHAALGRADRRYDVVLPDTASDQQIIRLLVDGCADLEITVDAEFRVVEPSVYAGAPLLGGFARWAGERLSAVECEKMFLLQRGAFVGRGQKLDIAQFYDRPGALSGPPPASCFGSQPIRYETSRRLANARAGLLIDEAARFGFS